MTYSPDFRQKVLQKLAEGLSVRKVAQLFGINFMTVQKWKTNPVPKSQQIHPPKKISKDALLADVQTYPTNWQVKNQTNVIGALHEGNFCLLLGCLSAVLMGMFFKLGLNRYFYLSFPKTVWWLWTMLHSTNGKQSLRCWNSMDIVFCGYRHTVLT